MAKPKVDENSTPSLDCRGVFALVPLGLSRTMLKQALGYFVVTFQSPKRIPGVFVNLLSRRIEVEAVRRIRQDPETGWKEPGVWRSYIEDKPDQDLLCST